MLKVLSKDVYASFLLCISKSVLLSKSSWKKFLENFKTYSNAYILLKLVVQPCVFMYALTTVLILYRLTKIITCPLLFAEHLFCKNLLNSSNYIKHQKWKDFYKKYALQLSTHTKMLLITKFSLIKRFRLTSVWRNCNCT